MSQYSTAELSAATGVSVYTLAYWASRGVIIPDVDSGGRQGRGRRWSTHHIQLVRWLKLFRDNGFSLRRAKRAAVLVLENIQNDQMLPLHKQIDTILSCQDA